MREFTSICFGSKLLPTVNDGRSQLKYVTVSVKEVQSTRTVNSLVFHTNSAVDFSFAGISAISMAISVSL
jgi:hypothetical protein